MFPDKQNICSTTNQFRVYVGNSHWYLDYFDGSKGFFKTLLVMWCSKHILLILWSVVLNITIPPAILPAVVHMLSMLPCWAGLA